MGVTLRAGCSAHSPRNHAALGCCGLTASPPNAMLVGKLGIKLQPRLSWSCTTALQAVAFFAVQASVIRRFKCSSFQKRLYYPFAIKPIRLALHPCPGLLSPQYISPIHFTTVNTD
jgi:hypothetical protein